MPQFRMLTTGEFALLVGVLIYLGLFPLLGYKGFVYLAGIVFFSLGLRWQIRQICARETFELTLYYWTVKPALSWPGRWIGTAHWLTRTVPVPAEARLASLIGTGLVLAAIFVLPIFALVLQRQGTIFSAQFDEHLPAILAFLDQQMTWINARFGTEADIDVDAGLAGLRDTLSQVAGNTLTDMKDGLQGIVGSTIKFVGVLLSDYVLLCIAAIIVAMIINAENWKKEVAFFHKRLDRGIQNPVWRRRIGRWGELFQEAIGLFMVGYLEVGLRLTILFFVAMFIVAPLGIGFATALFMSFVLGFVTAIPKIGGLIGMVLAILLMGANLEAGLGWFGFHMFSTGSVGGDVLVRIVLLGAIAKVMGLFEAYRFTPEIVGERLGLTKLIIVATILMAAKAGGFFAMIWGIIAMLLWQSFKRLDEEAEAEEERDKAETQAAE